jgi:hypothetical protein
MWKSLTSCAASTALLLLCFACTPTSSDDGGGGGAEGEGEGEAAGEGEGESSDGEGEGESSEGEGEGESSEGEGEGEDEDEDEVVDDTTGAVELIQLVQTPSTLTEQMLHVALEMVSRAALATGDLTTHTGTVTVVNDTNTYSSQPSDELVMIANGVTTRAVIVTMDGDFAQPSFRAFYGVDHDVVVSSFTQGAITMSAESHLRGSDGTREAEGTFATGQDFTFNGAFTSVSEVDGNFSELQRVDTDSGTLRDTGMDIEWSTTNSYHLLVGSAAVEDVNTDLAFSGTAFSSSWTLQNGAVRRTFRDSVAVEPDFWRGTGGAVFRDSRLAGELAAVVSPGRIQITFNDAVLEEHQR